MYYYHTTLYYMRVLLYTLYKIYLCLRNMAYIYCYDALWLPWTTKASQFNGGVWVWWDFRFGTDIFWKMSVVRKKYEERMNSTLVWRRRMFRLFYMMILSTVYIKFNDYISNCPSSNLLRNWWRRGKRRGLYLCRSRGGLDVDRCWKFSPGRGLIEVFDQRKDACARWLSLPEDF